MRGSHCLMGVNDEDLFFFGYIYIYIYIYISAQIIARTAEATRQVAGISEVSP